MSTADTSKFSFEMTVEETFDFEDGSTVFVGPSSHDVQLDLPARADVLVDGQHYLSVWISEERMPGNFKKGSRVIVTQDEVNTVDLKGRECSVGIR